MPSQREMQKSLLVDPLDKPGEYVHQDFNTDSVTSVQGLVWMPNKTWILGHIACAAPLLPVGIAQIIVGSIVMKYDSLKGTSGRTCGSFTLVSGILAIICAVISYLIWNMFIAKKGRNGKLLAIAPKVSKIEQSVTYDPRRWSLMLAVVAIPLCLAAAIVDGVDCVEPLEEIESCTSTIFDSAKYNGCSVTGYGGNNNAVCACIAEDNDDDSFTCTYLMKKLPSSLDIGSSGDGGTCDHLSHHLITWLQICTILSAISGALVTVIGILDIFSAFSHRSCFNAVVLARHEDTSFDYNEDINIEFSPSYLSPRDNTSRVDIF
mmetsp:Transcript_11661/g.15009  ORF Transcript_11661/g.15009 Transcript_11661/m.15009 type:complete len:320 (-) Transcript_11661:148-1107(-)